MDFGKVLALIDAMNRERVDATIIGSIAMALHGFPRATTDIDFLIRADAANVESLRRALRDVWNDPAIDDISAAELLGEYPTLFYGPADETFGIDVMTRVGEYTYETLPAEDVVVGERRFRVVTLDALHRMKQRTGRYLDQWDSHTIDDKIADEELHARLEV
jgi:hypothetical protein